MSPVVVHADGLSGVKTLHDRDLEKGFGVEEDVIREEVNMDYKAFSEEISRMVRSQSFPVGVKLVKEADKLPKEAARPAKFGVKIAVCQWTTMARRWGRVLGATAEDINCTACLAALGLKRLENRRHLGQYFLEMGFFDDIDLAEKFAKELELINPGEISAVAYFPLDMAPVDPDVIVIYGTPAQMARLAAGYIHNSGELIELKSAFGLSCLAAIKPYFSKKPAFVIPGRGERILAGTDEGEMFFTFPAGYAEQLLDGLRKTQEKGTRYPVQSYVIYEPPIIRPMKNLADKLSDS